MVRRPTGTAGKTEFIEWAVAAMSAVAVIWVIAYLVRDGLSNEGAPRLEVSGTHFDAAAGRLDFAIRNAGGRAASAVAVSAVTRGPDGAVAERRSVTIDHVPPGSEITGAFLLDAPAQVVVDGYVDP